MVIFVLEFVRGFVKNLWVDVNVGFSILGEVIGGMAIVKPAISQNGRSIYDVWRKFS